MHRLLAIYTFVVLFIIYYFFQFGTIDQTEIILTIATFLFATFTGFFLSRQGTRHSSIRSEIANFDGHLTAIYRNFGYFGKRSEDAARKIIEEHYERIVAKDGWDFHFVEKSNTLMRLHDLLGKQKPKTEIQIHAAEYIIGSLQQLQIIRKSMVSLHIERIPMYQWVLIIILGVILLLTVSAVPTLYALIPTVLKAAFGTSIFIVLIILWELDTLTFFEGTTGKSSAEDVLGILHGDR